MASILYFSAVGLFAGVEEGLGGDPEGCDLVEPLSVKLQGRGWVIGKAGPWKAGPARPTMTRMTRMKMLLMVIERYLGVQ